MWIYHRAHRMGLTSLSTLYVTPFLFSGQIIIVKFLLKTGHLPLMTLCEISMYCSLMSKLLSVEANKKDLHSYPTTVGWDFFNFFYYFLWTSPIHTSSNLVWILLIWNMIQAWTQRGFTKTIQAVKAEPIMQHKNNQRQ